MSGGEIGIKRETAIGIVGGLIMITICVMIGSIIAQSMGGHHEGPAGAHAPAEAAPAPAH